MSSSRARLASVLSTLPLLSPASFHTLLFFLSFAGFLLVSPSIYLRDSVASQFICILLAFFVVFSFHPRVDFLRKFNTSPSYISHIVSRSTSHRYYILVLSVQLLAILSYAVNSNFASSESSVRFASVRIPALHSISLYLSSIVPFLLLIAPLRSWRSLFLSPPWFLSNLLFFAGFAAASGRSKLFSLLSQYLFVYAFRFAPSLNLSLDLILKSFIRFLKQFSLKKSAFLVTALIVIVFIIAVLFALSVTTGGYGALVYRVLHGYDQLDLLTSRSITIVSNGQAPVYPLVWLKTFLRPLLPGIYDIRFDNYTEHLLYLSQGSLTSAYSQTAWAPNNLLFTDSILAFPASIFLQSINAFIVYTVYLYLSISCFAYVVTRQFMSSAKYALCLPVAANFFNHPLLLAQDSQLAINSICFSLIFSFSIYLICTLFCKR